MKRRFILLIIISFIVIASVESRSCVLVECPTSPIGVNNCTHHTECKGKSEFSASSPSSCICFNVLPSQCKSTNSNGTHTGTSKLLSICETKSSLPLPQPQISNEGRHVVSVVVERFFESEKYKNDYIKLSNLFINARFRPADNKTCIQKTGVEVFVYTNGNCLLRSRVTMPGIDHKSEDNYYYDDKSPLETSFSRHYFFGSDNIDFWLDATREKIVKLPDSTKNATISFKTLLKSPIVSHHPVPLTPPILPLTPKYMTTSHPAL